MDLLVSLGVNSSLAVQFVIFAVVYTILKYVLFRPYFAAYNERSERTIGKAELAERYIAETRDLEEQFAVQAREMNEQFKSIYDRTRAEALKEYDYLVNEARGRAKSFIDTNNRQIRVQMEAARADLSKEVAGVSQLINQKLIGKDLTL